MNYKKKSYNFANLDLWLTFLRDDLELKGVAMGFARLLQGKGTHLPISMNSRKKFMWYLAEKELFILMVSI